jgi:RpiR family transcriptional regulator, carbohydrate utilization regulator
MSDAALGTLLQRIRARMRSFTAAEKKFARYVLVTEDLIYRSITSATEESGCGYGTVIRFCQHMGFSGFQDFKINLALERRPAAAGDEARAKGWLLKAAERAGEQLRATAAEVDDARLAAAARAVLKARRLLVIGVAGSYPSALELSYRLSRMGIPAVTEADTHMQSIRAATLGEKDVLVAISFTGATTEVLKAVSLAREAGAAVVALTNSPRSPLAEAASFVLCTARWEDMSDEEIGSRLPVHFLVESLCERVFKDHAGSADALARTAGSVEDRLTERPRAAREGG